MWIDNKHRWNCNCQRSSELLRKILSEATLLTTSTKT